MSSCDMETNLHVILEFLPHKQRKFSSVVIRFWINCHYCLYYEHYILICFHLNPRNYSFFVGIIPTSLTYTAVLMITHM